MRSIFLIFLTFIIQQEVIAQKFVELNVSPNFSYRFLKSTSSHLKDSLDNGDQIRATVGYGLSATIGINKSVDITTGIRFNDYGFTRIWYDLQFLDEVHPDIGRLEDFSQTVQKDAYFYYKFKYLDIPIRINYQLSKKRNNQDFRIFFSAGIVNQIYFEDQFKVLFKGFSVGGKRVYKKIPTGYSLRKYNVALVVGSKLMYKIHPDYWITANPEFNIGLMDANTDANVQIRLIQFSGNFGIAKSLN